jgi:exodeoxyribonuclease V alpha subunit
MEEQLQDLVGTVENFVYFSEESHFGIARFRLGDGTGVPTIKGTLVHIKAGETLRVTGKWVDDPRYGEQFEVKYFQVITPSSLEGIQKYLGSGLVPGIGPKFAARLVEFFGTRTLDVIESHPEELYQVQGIGKVRLENILSAWREQKVLRDSMIFLRGYGLSDSISMRVYKKYGFQAMQKIQENPYVLAHDIEGVGFVTADRMARNLGFEMRSPERCRAGILYVLSQSMQEGHCYLPMHEVLVRSMDLLQVSADLVEESCKTCVDSQELVERDDRIYLKVMERVEEQVSVRLATILRAQGPTVSMGAREFQELLPDFRLSVDQVSALKNCMREKVSIITGGPGVGKTTILATVVRIFQNLGRDLTLCSPTGKAARRMEEATGYSASTMHKLLKYTGTFFEYDEQNPLEGDVFILDEMSMVDLFLFHAFLKALPLESTLILVGDVDQLPSVGPGFVLRDLIQSETIPVTRLKEIFRQKGKSDIVLSAHAVNEGRWFPADVGQDFFFIHVNSPKKAMDTLEKLLVERIPAKFDLDPVQDIQVLSPMYRGEVGIDALNQRLQDLLNPSNPSLEVYQKCFREGDKVMQLSNNYDKEVFNGDQGIVESIDFESSSLWIRFDEGRRVFYEKKSLDDLCLSYASSIHKVQGSEYPGVVLIMTQAHFTLLRRGLLYTAMTRGKKLVIALGQRAAFEKAIADPGGRQRFTSLVPRLQKWQSFEA